MSKEMRIFRAIGEIDDAYIDEAAPVQGGKAVNFRAWANIAAAAAAAVLVIGLGAFTLYTINNNVSVDVPHQTTTAAEVTTPTEVTTDETDMPIVMMGNPFEYFDTLEEAAQSAEFEISVPESFGIYTDRKIATVMGDMIEVTYYDADGNEGFSIRKAVGTDDPSGVYYYFETIVPLQSKNGEMSGVSESDGTVGMYKAVWTDGTYAYSVTAPYDSEDRSGSQKGFTQSEMEEIIRSVK